jgi:superfamily II DNA or RNA helicase
MSVPKYVRAEAVYDYTDALYETYAREDRFGEPFNLSHKVGTHLMVPRQLAVLHNDKRDEGVAINCTSSFKPMKPEQPRVIAESVALLRDDKSHVTQAPTGFGKTYVGAEIAGQIGKRTLIVTTKEDIIDQWVEALCAVFSLEKEDIGIWQADRCDIGKDFTVGLVQSIMKGPDRYSDEAYAGYGLVMFDEVHRMGADKFSETCRHLPAKLRLGLSATPTRKDGRDIVIKAHIGKTLVTAVEEVMIPKVYMVRSHWKVPLAYRDGKMVRMPHQAGKLGRIVKFLARDDARNAMITDLIQQAHKKGRSTIVFSDTLELLAAIQTSLSGKVPSRDIGHYVGLDFYPGGKEASKKQRDLDSVKPVVLATYSMASEATNLPWLDTAVLASPRSDVVQIVGRIRREYEDKRFPVVFDICDMDSHVFKGYSMKRNKWYHSIGCEIIVP